MKTKILIAFTAFALLACNGDEIDDLKKRLNRVENSIGNEPIKFKFATTDYDDETVTKNATYFFQSTAGNTHYLYDMGEGYYEVYVERFEDVNWNNSVNVEFDYNANTGEVSNVDIGLYFENPDRNINAYFAPCCYTGHTATVTIKSFNASTGKIEFTVHAATTESSENNVYGNPMATDLSFKGTLGIFNWEND